MEVPQERRRAVPKWAQGRQESGLAIPIVRTQTLTTPKSKRKAQTFRLAAQQAVVEHMLQSLPAELCVELWQLW